jgi:hypothetical protein
MNIRFVFCFTVLMLLASAALARDVAGWVEKVRIHPGGIEVKAKLDTGAKTSSLHCTCIRTIERNGEQWVSFAVTNYNDETIHMERRLERIATIRRHFGESQERYVVRVGLCVGDTYKETEVTLVDRTGFNYQMLIGRSFLTGDLLVDPQETFILPPRCNVGGSSGE